MCNTQEFFVYRDIFRFLMCIYSTMFRQKFHFPCGFDIVSYDFLFTVLSVKVTLMCGLELGIVMWTL